MYGKENFTISLSCSKMCQECEYRGMKVTDKNCIYSEMKTNVGSLLVLLLRSDSFDFACFIESP